MVSVLLVVTALIAADPPAPERPEGAPSQTSQAALAEYNALRSRMPHTADAHWKLGLWCEKAGLKAEAEAEFLAVTSLDPQRDAAWKKLGYEKHSGRWTTPAQLAAERAESDAQRKADTRWRPLFTKWKGWLGLKAKRAEAETAMAEVNDPRAVPAIWDTFAKGSPADQQRAIDLLGHIDGERPSRALAGLAIHGKTDLVRRSAVETLSRRKPDDVLMSWIGLLREPIKYEVRQVAGAGSPGILKVEGEQFNVRRFYAPPTVEQTEALFVDVPNGRHILPLQFNSSPPGPPPGAHMVGHIAGKDLYIYDYTWNISRPPPPKYPDPTPAYQQFERSQLQAKVDRDFEFDETAKMTVGAQAQLQNDVNVIESANATIRETNARLREALRRVSGKRLRHRPRDMAEVADGASRLRIHSTESAIQGHGRRPGRPPLCPAEWPPNHHLRRSQRGR